MNKNNNYDTVLKRPDILDCIANLSNDEVFTSPELVRKILDLLPSEIWSNKNLKFLDPGSKTGIFLREIALRLNKGLKREIPNLKKRLDHIFKNQIFGIAITELTLLMTKRSVYCSINANGDKSISEIFDNKNGNISYINHKHVWDRKEKSCTFCGAAFNIFKRDEKLENHAYEFIHTEKPDEIFKKMKFDVIVGNPPYQLKDGGHEASAKPIYQLFVEQAKKLNPKYLSMIIPSRWFSGGKGLDKFRSEMLNDKRIRVLHDFIDASECFGNGVSIKGGVCYFLWDRDNEGSCDVTTHFQGKVISNETRYLLENENRTFIRYGKAIPIVNKIRKFKEESFSSIVSSRKPFGLATNFDSKLKQTSNLVKVYANKKILFVNKKDINTNTEWINSHKIIVPKAVGVGNSFNDVVKPLYCEPSSICTETYIVIGPFKSKKECESVISFIGTRFFHFLLSLKKITQDTTQSVYEFIPLQKFDQIFSDELLFKKYKFDDEEIRFIEKMVHPNNEN